MKITTYSYNNPDLVIPYGILEPVKNLLINTDHDFKKNSGKYARNDIINALKQNGWSDRVVVDEESQISISSMYKNVGLCIQLGNTARFYADLLKLQLFYNKGRITCAIYLIPMKNAASAIGVNVANFERFTHELELYNNIITLPIYVIGFESGN